MRVMNGQIMCGGDYAIAWNDGNGRRKFAIVGMNKTQAESVCKAIQAKGLRRSLRGGEEGWSRYAGVMRGDVDPHTHARLAKELDGGLS